MQYEVDGYDCSKGMYRPLPADDLDYPNHDAQCEERKQDIYTARQT
jgi:hypothetical protein